MWIRPLPGYEPVDPRQRKAGADARGRGKIKWRCFRLARAPNGIPACAHRQIGIPPRSYKLGRREYFRRGLDAARLKAVDLFRLTMVGLSSRRELKAKARLRRKWVGDVGSELTGDKPLPPSET